MKMISIPGPSSIEWIQQRSFHIYLRTEQSQFRKSHVSLTRNNIWKISNMCASWIICLLHKTFRLTNLHLQVISYFSAISKKLTSEFHPWTSIETYRLLFSSYSGPENINISLNTLIQHRYRKKQLSHLLQGFQPLWHSGPFPLLTIHDIRLKITHLFRWSPDQNIICFLVAQFFQNIRQRAKNIL